MDLGSSLLGLQHTHRYPRSPLSVAFGRVPRGAAGGKQTEQSEVQEEALHAIITQAALANVCPCCGPTLPFAHEHTDHSFRTWYLVYIIRSCPGYNSSDPDKRC